MLKKIITVAFILSLANQISVFAEMTPLQLRVRSIFSEIRNRDKAEVAQIEEVEEEKIEVEENKTPVSAKPAKEEIPTQIILASDQDDVDDEDYDDEDEEEEEEEIVVATAPKSNHEVKSCEDKPKYELKTAAEVSSKDRKAQINKKWSFEVLGWNTELDGHIAIAKDEDALAQALNNGNSKIDLKNDTSLDKKKVPGLKLAYSNGGRSSFEFNWVNVEQDGHLSGEPKQFKGKLYNGDARFEINNAMYDLVWKYKFSHKVEESGREKSYVSGLLGVKASKMEFKFNGQAGEVNPATGQRIGDTVETSESKSETIPVPYIGVEAGTYLGEKVYLKGYYRYLKLNNIKDYDAEHSDYDVSLSYKLSGEGCDQDIFLDVGYRQVVYDVEGDGNDVELKYKGPYVGLEFRF